MKPIIWLPLIGLLTILACQGTPGLEELQHPLDLPTSAPTIAPLPEPGIDSVHPELLVTPLPADPEAASDQAFQASAVATLNSASGSESCSLPVSANLLVKADGTAQLTTSVPSIVDHANCTPGASEETWYFNGLADSTSQVVTFSSCNFERFSASGTMVYSSGAVVGEVNCANLDGVIFITLVAGK